MNLWASDGVPRHRADELHVRKPAYVEQNEEVCGVGKCIAMFSICYRIGNRSLLSCWYSYRYCHVSLQLHYRYNTVKLSSHIFHSPLHTRAPLLLCVPKHRSLNWVGFSPHMLHITTYGQIHVIDWEHIPSHVALLAQRLHQPTSFAVGRRLWGCSFYESLDGLTAQLAWAHAKMHH